MFTISLIALAVATLALATMAYFGIQQYNDNTDDTDVEITVRDLKRILIGLSVVIIASLGIMAYSHYTEKPDVSVQVEKN